MQAWITIIDGVGPGDTTSDWTGILYDGNGSTNPTTIPGGHFFTFNLDAAYDIENIIIFNDRGVIDSGVNAITAEFFGASGSIGSESFNVASSLDPQTFNAFINDPGSNGIYEDVTSIVLQVNSLHGTTNDITTEQYQWREVQFTATTVPEPSSLFLSQAGLMLLVLRRKR